MSWRSRKRRLQRKRAKNKKAAALERSFRFNDTRAWFPPQTAPVDDYIEVQRELLREIDADTPGDE